MIYRLELTMNGLFSVGPDGATLDLLTILAIGVLVYLIAVAAHEALGHGATCLAVGGRVRSLNTVGCECDYAAVSRQGRRIVEAGGTAVNLFLGMAALVTLRALPGVSASVRYFLFLSVLVNLFLGAGYLLVSPLFRFGDWNLFIEGFESPTRWRIGLSSVGLVVSLLALVVGLRELDAFCGVAAPLRLQRAHVLTLVPYLGGSIGLCAMALLGRESRSQFLLASIGIFGGTIWLVWTGFLIGAPGPSTPETPIGVPRDGRFVIVAAVALVAYAAVLGRGRRFGSR